MSLIFSGNIFFFKKKKHSFYWNALVKSYVQNLEENKHKEFTKKTKKKEKTPPKKKKTAVHLLEYRF